MHLMRISCLTLLLVFSASQGQADLQAAEDAESAAGPRAPISFSYEILGNPIVGQPIAINLLVASTQSEPISVEYRIIDGSSMVFPESQALQVEVTPSSDAVAARQQIIVVPQREGRLYLNVSGSVETTDGTLIQASAIPIQVASAPRSGQPSEAEEQTPEGQAGDATDAEAN